MPHLFLLEILTEVDSTVEVKGRMNLSSSLNIGGTLSVKVSTNLILNPKILGLNP